MISLYFYYFISISYNVHVYTCTGIYICNIHVNCTCNSLSPLFIRGWEQLEVTCNPKKDDPNNLWNVEGNFNPACE